MEREVVDTTVYYSKATGVAKFGKIIGEFQKIIAWSRKTLEAFLSIIIQISSKCIYSLSWLLRV